MRVYELVKNFKNKYPMTIAWRLKAHSKIIEKHMNDGENLLYAFAGQKGETYHDLIHTYIVAVTDKRLIIGHKRLFFGYFCVSITPDLFNDLTVDAGLIWGKVIIDTLSEQVAITNVDNKCLAEVETAITSYMMEAKKEFVKQEK